MRGTILEGRFRVKDLRREGILFDVYDAADLKDKTTVIVKSLRADWALEKELIKKLKTNLARQRGKMVPGMAPIISCESILSDELIPFFARTYSVGPSLSKRLEMGAAFNAELITSAAKDLAGLIKRLHAEGWVHGGLHGGNIFSDGKQNVVTDLGVAETSLLPPVLISDQRLKYLPQELLGKPRPPEPADDLYAWGAVIFTMLTGSPPERACDRDLTRLMEARYQGFGIDVVMRAFHHDAESRFRDAAELLRAVNDEFRIIAVTPSAPAAEKPAPKAAPAAAAPPPSPPPPPADRPAPNRPASAAGKREEIGPPRSAPPPEAAATEKPTLTSYVDKLGKPAMDTKATAPGAKGATGSPAAAVAGKPGPPAPGKPGVAPAKPGTPAAKPGAAPAKPGSAPAKPGTAPAKPGAVTPTKPGPGTAPGKAPAAPAKPAGPDPVKQLRSEIVKRHALLAGQNFYEMLEVQRDAPQEDIKRSFHRMAKRLHPDRISGLSAAEQASGQGLFEALSEAYSCLTDETRRTLYDIDLRYRESATARAIDQAIVTDAGRDRKVIADDYYKDGMALLSRGDLWGAAQTFRQALLIDPLRFDFHLELGRTLAKNPRWHREAERAFRRCLELDPKNAESFYLLGLLYRENGMELRAEMELRKALEIEPENPRYKDAMTAPKR